MGPQQQLRQIPAGLLVLRTKPPGRLLPPWRLGVVHLDEGAPRGLLDPVAAARGLKPELHLTKRVPGTHGRGGSLNP
jgi:hypothetical protein